MPSSETIWRTIADVFGRDLARPIEWLSLLLLAGWLQFLLTQPDVFQSPRYGAFAGVSPWVWSTVIASILVAQLVALRPSRHAPTIRFVAMALATGIWTVIALSFWSGSYPILARTHSVIAFAVIVTAIYLGLRRR